MVAEQGCPAPHHVVLRGGEYAVVDRARCRPPLAQTTRTDLPVGFGLVSPEEQEPHPLAPGQNGAQISDAAYRGGQTASVGYQRPSRRLISGCVQVEDRPHQDGGRDDDQCCGQDPEIDQARR